MKIYFFKYILSYIYDNIDKIFFDYIIHISNV